MSSKLTSISIPPPPPINPPLPPDVEKISILWDGTTTAREMIYENFPEICGGIELYFMHDDEIFRGIQIIKLGETISRDETGEIVTL